MKAQGLGKSVQELSGLFGYSRQHFYQQRQRLSARTLREAAILDFVDRHRKEQSQLGTVKLQHLWNKQAGVQPIGRDALYDLLRRHHRLVRKRAKYRPRLTDGNGQSIYPDYRKRLVVDRPALLWCSDTTYIQMQGSPKWLYLTCVTDEYSHLIVGYTLSESLETSALLPAYQMAVDQELPAGQLYFEQPLFLHTDRAGQFKSKLYQDFTTAYGITRSMAAAGKSHENPVAERLNGILKNELLGRTIFSSLAEAKQAIAKAIKVYNECRPHLSCELRTPREAHQQTGVLNKLWRQRPGQRC